MTLSVKTWLLIATYAILLGVGIFLLVSQGAAYRYSFPPEPPEWDLPCDTRADNEELSGPFIRCEESHATSSDRKIFLLGDSHAVQLVFPLREVADRAGMALYFPNTNPLNYGAYPYTFWEATVTSDELIDFVIENSNPGDFFITSLHRGRFNPSRDAHISMDVQFTDQSTTAKTFESNMMRFLPKLGNAGLNVYLVKDGPLLPDSMTSISECMYQFTEKLRSTCNIDLQQDLHTRAQLDQVFDKLDATHTFVQVVDVAPELFDDNLFTPISSDGEYRMIDKHHLSEVGAMELTPLFETMLSSAGR